MFSQNHSHSPNPYVSLLETKLVFIYSFRTILQMKTLITSKNYHNDLNCKWK